MTFYSYLKAARERCGITQSELADKIGVSPQTIQNWEKNTLPDKNYWKVIIEQLKLTKEEFINYYTDDILPYDNMSNEQSFPYFLFPDDLIDEIKNIRLTADEQELLGLEELYSISHDMYGDYKFKITESENLPILPYEYVRRVGAFRVMSLNDSLNNKIDGWRDFVIKQIKKAPEIPFDILKCSADQLLELCTLIECYSEYYNKSYCYGGYELSTWKDSIQTIIHLLQQIEDAGDSLVIIEDYNGESGYYEEGVECDCYSSFCDCEGNLYFEGFMKLVEKESKDPNYLAVKKKYVKDMLFYDEHSSMMNHHPKEPEFKGTINVEMTERGRQLLTWYKDNL